jgi:excisionase family DNA binding protein
MDKEKYPADPPQNEESLRTKLLSDKEENQDWYSWLTTQEAATLSGYDIQHVRRLAREGKLGAVKRGRDWWIDYEMFMAYLESMEANEDKRSGPKGKPDPGALRGPLPSPGEPKEQ